MDRGGVVASREHLQLPGSDRWSRNALRLCPNLDWRTPVQGTDRAVRANRLPEGVLGERSSATSGLDRRRRCCRRSLRDALKGRGIFDLNGSSVTFELVLEANPDYLARRHRSHRPKLPPEAPGIQRSPSIIGGQIDRRLLRTGIGGFHATPYLRCYPDESDTSSPSLSDEAPEEPSHAEPLERRAGTSRSSWPRRPADWNGFRIELSVLPITTWNGHQDR